MVKKPTSDLFGKVLYSFFQGDKTPYAIVRDDGWREFPEDPGVYFRSGLDDVERDGLKYAKGHILDVGCGAGRYALYFQKKGLRVTAIDTDRHCVKTAKLRGLRTVLRDNILSPKLLPKHIFNTVWLGGNNLGVAGKVRNVPRIFKVIAAVTVDDAVILATGLDAEKTSNPDHLAYHRRQRKKGIYPGQMRLRIEYKDSIGEWFPWLHLSSALLRKTLMNTPWRIEKIIRSTSGDGHYLAVIRKRIK